MGSKDDVGWGPDDLQQRYEEYSILWDDYHDRMRTYPHPTFSNEVLDFHDLA